MTSFARAGWLTTLLALSTTCVLGCGGGGGTDGGFTEDGGPIQGDGGPGSDASPPGADAGPACDGVDCSALDDECSIGTCNATTGECEAVPVANDTACDDGDACTTSDVCTAGVCGGGAVDCSAMSDACNVGTCNATTGACEAVAVTDGTSCDDGSLCTTRDQCTGGACGGAAVDCSAMSDGCNVGMCDPTTGACEPVALADGTSCDDGDLCTSGDACTGGSCAGSAVDCSAMSDACNVGACDPSDGSCQPVALADGTSCDDGDLCTTGDACTGGSCGGSAVDCSAMSDACNIGTCDATDGSCDPVPVSNGTACDDGFECTATDSCQAGACQGADLACHVAPGGAVTTTLPGIGGLGGGAFSDVCPDGQVLTGLAGYFHNASGDRPGYLQGICSSVTVDYTGAVVTTRQGTLPLHGSASGAAYESSCAAGEVVVGFGVRADTYVYNVTVRCAPLTLGAAATGYAIQIGTASDLASVGGSAGTAQGPFDCPAGEVVVGVHGRSGEWIDMLGMSCGPIAGAREAVRILYDCNPDAGVMDAHAGTACHTLSPGAAGSASWVVLSSGVTSVTLFPTTSCTGASATITSDTDFCGLWYSDGSYVNDRVGSYIINY